MIRIYLFLKIYNFEIKNYGKGGFERFYFKGKSRVFKRVYFSFVIIGDFGMKEKG
jgi:hypothetical protein